MRDSHLNWFEFYELLEYLQNVKEVVQDFFYRLPEVNFTEHELVLISQSGKAFLCTEEASKELSRQARVLNEEIVSDSDSDSSCTHEYSQLTSPLSSAKKLITKKRAAIRRKANRLRIKKKEVIFCFERCVCTRESVVDNNTYI